MIQGFEQVHSESKEYETPLHLKEAILRKLLAGIQGQALVLKPYSPLNVKPKALGPKPFSECQTLNRVSLEMSEFGCGLRVWGAFFGACRVTLRPAKPNTLKH